MKKISQFLLFWSKNILLIIFVVLISGRIFLKPILALSASLCWDVDVSIQKAEIDWLGPKLILKGITFGNPYGFSRDKMMEINRTVFQFDWYKPFFKNGALKPLLLDVNIGKLELMRRVSGHLNLELFVHPEKGSRKKHGWRISPEKTLVDVGEINETDFTTPLLQKRSYSPPNKQFPLEEKPHLKAVAQAFVRMLFERIGLSSEGEIVLPAPEYHGLISTMEQETQAQTKGLSGNTPLNISN